MGAQYTAAQAAAAARYKSKMKELRITVTPDQAERYKAAAAASDQSLTAYVIKAVEDRIERDEGARETQPQE